MSKRMSRVNKYDLSRECAVRARVPISEAAAWVDLVLKVVADKIVDSGTVVAFPLGCLQVTESGGKPHGVTYMASGYIMDKVRNPQKAEPAPEPEAQP